MEEKIYNEEKKIEWKNTTLDSEIERLKKYFNDAPLYDPKHFGGRFFEGDNIIFGKHTSLAVSSEGHVQVRAILERNGCARGVFIPLPFFRRCWYYKGSAADVMTTFPDLYSMLDFLVKTSAVIEVSHSEYVAPKEGSEEYYRYTLNLK